MRVPSILALVLCAACGGDEEQAVRPNVILITLDTTRADALSSYGFSNPGWTPHLDQLAADGVRFSNAHATSAVTPVSHASILTGQFQYHHRLRVLSAASGFRLPDDQPTVATVLAEAGYDTGAVHSAFPVSSYFGLLRGVEHADSFEGELQFDEKTQKTRWDLAQNQRRSDETSQRVLDMLATLEEPYFLWIHYWDPHDGGLRPPPEWLESEQYSESLDEMRDGMYAMEVRYQDGQIGRVFDALRASGQFDRTVVALTADHGQGLSDGKQLHGWPQHRVLYREQLHVPLIVKLPSGSASTSVVDALVRTVDVAPTLLDYAGLPTESLTVAGASDGRSLRNLIEGAEDEPRVHYADQINGYDANAGMVKRRPEAAFLFAVVDSPWKLIFRPHMVERSELFHVVDDPREERDVAAENPEVVRRLVQDIARRSPWVVRRFPADGSDAPDVGDILGALGYTGGDEELTEDGDLEWTWTCLEHTARTAEDPGRCPECDARLVPLTRWR